MARSAPEIVYASVQAIEPGRVFGEGEAPEDTLQAVNFILRVEDAIATQELRHGDSVPLEIGLAYLSEDVRDKYRDAVGDEGLFFLIRSGAPQPEFGYEGEAEELAVGVYGLVTSQGLFINDRGRVLVSYPYDRFPSGLDGTSFPELVERVRAITQE